MEVGRENRIGTNQVALIFEVLRFGLRLGGLSTLRSRRCCFGGFVFVFFGCCCCCCFGCCGSIRFRFFGVLRLSLSSFPHCCNTEQNTESNLINLLQDTRQQGTRDAKDKRENKREIGFSFGLGVETLERE